MMKTVVGILAALPLFMTQAAVAGLTPIGEPFDSNSWGQRFKADTGSYDHFQLTMISAGDAFEKLQAFSKAQWSETANTGTFATADGPRVTTKDLLFNVIFEGVKSNPLKFVFQAWDGSTLADNTEVSWSGSAWSFRAASYNPGRIEAASVVPAPAAAGLVFIGLGLVGWFRRRFA